MYSRSKSILMSFCFCVFVILGLATNDDGNIKNNKTVVVKLHPGYWRLCGINSEGVDKNVEITISVDIVKARTSKTLYEKYTFFVGNDDYLQHNLRFSGIKIPKSGIFEISVSVEGKSCFRCCRCCFSLSCPSGSGKPFFEGDPARFRVDDVYDGYEIYIVPVYQECL